MVLLLLLLLLSNESFTTCVGRSSSVSPEIFPFTPLSVPGMDRAAPRCSAFRLIRSRASGRDSGGEHFHADSETSRVTPAWRCHAWLWKGKNNASLEKGEKKSSAVTILM